MKWIGRSTPCLSQDPLVRAVYQAWQDSGMSLDDLAKRSGYSKQGIVYWFRAQRNPPLLGIRDLCSVLGIEIYHRRVREAEAIRKGMAR